MTRCPQRQSSLSQHLTLSQILDNSSAHSHSRRKLTCEKTKKNYLMLQFRIEKRHYDDLVHGIKFIYVQGGKCYFPRLQRRRLKYINNFGPALGAYFSRAYRSLSPSRPVILSWTLLTIRRTRVITLSRISRSSFLLIAL